MINYQATASREMSNGSSQNVYRFENGYGASVVRGPYSYGGDEGLYELAVVKYDGEGPYDFKLCYDTEITDDVIGYQSPVEIDELLAKIERLPK